MRTSRAATFTSLAFFLLPTSITLADDAAPRPPLEDCLADLSAGNFSRETVLKAVQACKKTGDRSVQCLASVGRVLAVVGRYSRRVGGTSSASL